MDDLHLKPAPTRLQQVAAGVALREVEGFDRMFNAALTRAEDPDGHFSFLMIARDRRMRQLAYAKLKAEEGLAVVRGRSYQEIANLKPTVIYDGLSQDQDTIGAVLVVIEADSELDDWTKTIEEVGRFLLQDRVATFNGMPETWRHEQMEAWGRGERKIKGFSKDLVYMYGDRLRFLSRLALLEIK